MMFLFLLCFLVRPIRSDLMASGQLSYLDGALKASRMGGSLVGVCGKDFVLLASVTTTEKSSHEKLAYPPERLWRLTRAACLGCVGFSRDASLVADFAREECAAHRFRFGSDPVATRLANEVFDAVAAAARQGQPLGAQVVVAGVGPTGPILCHVDPAGREIRGLRAIAVGNNDKKITEELRHRMSEVPETVEAAETILRDALRAAAPEPPRQKPTKGLAALDPAYVSRKLLETQDLLTVEAHYLCLTQDDYTQSRPNMPPDFAWMHMTKAEPLVF